MVRNLTVPTAFGNNTATFSLGYNNPHIGIEDTEVGIYADTVRLDTTPDNDTATIWLRRSGVSFAHVYLPRHVARRVAIEAEHEGVNVSGL